jgi:DNA-binding response OmpR family regulator
VTSDPRASLVMVVEDDPAIAQMVSLQLELSGYRTHVERDGLAALAAIRRDRPDVVLLDIGLPGLDGIQVCRRLRAEDDWTPILFVTARDDEVDRVVGLELGADDYVTKPFELPELVARARAVMRRSGEDPPEQALAVGALEIDPAGFEVRRGSERIELTATEFRLLLELARRPRQVFTRELLLERVWNYDYLGDSRLVDVAVQRLRAKVEVDPKHPTLLQTVRGVGYRLDPSG